MDSSRVLLALQEQLKWQRRKARIEEKLRILRIKKREVLSQLEEAKARIMELTTLTSITEPDRTSREATVRIDGVR